jgi:hypothetical protein
MRLEKEDWNVLSDLAMRIAFIIGKELEAGVEPDREASFEERELYAKMAEQLDFMEIKYGPHPLILDTMADIAKDYKEKIRLKEAARSLCLANDFELRGNITTELAEIHLEESGNVRLAKELIDEAISDLKQGSDLNGLEMAVEVKGKISSQLEGKDK